ncbi:protein-glutamine gamma-glutamyltransferase K-like isoform X2 [Montipora foliosa]|uniref:protein-glutamine gamma-glutamyltransferase K-like isoform X2 n=1 Tax=Montipora foliosa TaxID=591990 RepID=UPI0035F1F543
MSRKGYLAGYPIHASKRDSKDSKEGLLGDGLEGRTSTLSDKEFRAKNKALLPSEEKPEVVSASLLKPKQVDFHLKENHKAHRTDEYDAAKTNLIIRRGQPFDITVTFSRQYKKDMDTIVLQFATGNQPQESKGSIQRLVISDDLVPTKWGMKIKHIGETAVTFTVMPSAKAIIGLYEVFVETKIFDKEGKKLISKYLDHRLICLLFNAWCQDDQVYMEKEVDRKEYVLADHGYLWYGNIRKQSPMPWVFGQFEEVSLNCALWLLDRKGLPTTARSSPIHIVRTMSAMVNSNDADNGILVGRWTKDYPEGTTKPTDWTGSVRILQEFWDGKSDVKYGQCWVFSGLVTTLLRALGLPTRSVTNFASAHDSDASTTVDMHLDEEYNRLEYLDRDSIWNFHVWNESWFKRPDLPEGHDGWQAHDATPQETSGGVFRCGPASVNAVKRGEVYLPYDTAFVFAEVNADKVYWVVSDDDGSMTAVYTDKRSIGHFVSTRDPASHSRLDVTSEYKFPDGCEEEREAVRLAYKHSEAINREEGVTEGDVNFKLEVVDEVAVGNGFEIKVLVSNSSDQYRSVKINIISVLAFYTGISAKPLKQMKEVLHLRPSEEKVVVLPIESGDYLKKITGDENIQVNVNAKVEGTGQSCVIQDVVEFKKPELIVTALPETAKEGELVQVTAHFTNTLPVRLTNGRFHFEASGMNPKSAKIKSYKTIGQETVKASAKFTATRDSKCTIVVSFQSDELAGVRGQCSV